MSDLSVVLQAIAEVEEAAALRPGDALVLRVSAPISHDEFRQLVDRMGELLPGIKVLVVNADGMAIYRPDDTGCTCPVVDVAPRSGKPEYVLGEVAVDCPVHGAERALAVEDAKRRAREAAS